jgi:hypothetical protein
MTCPSSKSSAARIGRFSVLTKRQGARVDTAGPWAVDRGHLKCVDVQSYLREPCLAKTNHRARRADQAKAAKVIAAHLGGHLAGRRSCVSPSHPTNKAKTIRHPVPSLLLILASDPVRHLPTDQYQDPGPKSAGTPVQGDIRLTPAPWIADQTQGQRTRPQKAGIGHCLFIRHRPYLFGRRSAP